MRETRPSSSSVRGRASKSTPTSGPTFSAFVEDQFRRVDDQYRRPAGTVFIANTVAIHRGLMPTAKPRLIVWARYGLGCNTNSTDLEQGPLARILTPIRQCPTLCAIATSTGCCSSSIDIQVRCPRRPSRRCRRDPPSSAPMSGWTTCPLPALPTLTSPAERSLAAARRLEASKASQAPAKRPESGLAPKAKAMFRRLWDQASQGS